MKKIISLLSVFAIMLTMVTTVAFAADNEIVFTEKNKTSNSVDIEISAKTSYSNINIIQFSLDFSEALNQSGATLSATNGVATLNYVKASKKVKVAFTDAKGEGLRYTSGSVLGTVTLTGVSNDFSIKLLNGGRDVPAIALDDKSSVLSDFGTIAADIKMVETPTAKAAVAGKAIEEGFKTFSTDAAIEFAVGATPTIEISKTGKNSDTKLTETLGSGVIGEGKTKIIPIVSYKIGRNGVEASDIFTIKVTNGTDTSSWTYTVPAE